MLVHAQGFASTKSSLLDREDVLAQLAQSFGQVPSHHFRAAQPPAPALSQHQGATGRLATLNDEIQQQARARRSASASTQARSSCSAASSSARSTSVAGPRLPSPAKPCGSPHASPAKGCPSPSGMRGSGLVARRAFSSGMQSPDASSGSCLSRLEKLATARQSPEGAPKQQRQGRAPDQARTPVAATRKLVLPPLQVGRLDSPGASGTTPPQHQQQCQHLRAPASVMPALPQGRRRAAEPPLAP